MHSCPHCGERVEERDVYCFECGTYLGGESEQRDTGQSRPPVEQSGTPPRDRTRGRRPPERSAAPAGTDHHSPEGGPIRITSLTTLWVALAASIFGALENAGAILFADELAEQATDLGFGDEITAGAIAIQGALGLVVALGVIALCVYYYRRGYVDRRFYWGLVLTGILGFFVGAALSFVVLVAVGGYGLLVALRRQHRQDQSPVGKYRD